MLFDLECQLYDKSWLSRWCHVIGVLYPDPDEKSVKGTTDNCHLVVSYNHYDNCLCKTHCIYLLQAYLRQTYIFDLPSV